MLLASQQVACSIPKGCLRDPYSTLETVSCHQSSVGLSHMAADKYSSDAVFMLQVGY